MSIRYWILLLCALVYQGVSAIDDNSMEMISVSQGLPNSQVNCIYHGEMGLIWFGTANGLCLYDGYDFIVKQSVPFDTTTLADDNIMRIVQNEQLNIWLLTNYGVEKFNFLTGKITKVRNIPNIVEVVDLVGCTSLTNVQLVYPDHVLSINAASHKADTLYHSTNEVIKGAKLLGEKLYLLREYSMVEYDMRTHEAKNWPVPDKLYAGVSQSIVRWDSNSIVYNNSNQLIHFNTKTGANKVLFTAPDIIVSTSNICKGNITLATISDVYQLKFDSNLNLVTSYPLNNRFTYTCNDILQDKNQIVWLATNRGIIKFNPHSNKIGHIPIPRSIIKYNKVENIVFESSNTGFAYINENGLISYQNSVTGELVRISLSSLYAIAYINKSYFLVGDKYGLVKANSRGVITKRISTFRGLKVHSIREHNGGVWVATNEGLYRGFNDNYEKVCQLQMEEFTFYEDNVYFISEKGFGFLNTKSCAYKILLDESNKSEYIRVLDLLQSLDGKIWLATDDGLYQFNPDGSYENNDFFKSIYKGNVFSLVEAKNQPEIWFASDLGIGSINYQSKQLMFLGYEDGVRQTSFVQGGAFLGKNGDIYFLSQYEIIKFNPDSIYRNTNVPNIVISQVKFIGEKESRRKLYYTSDTLTLLPGTRLLTLSLTTLDYYAPSSTVFEYSLTTKGRDLSWKEISGNKPSLGGIAPGFYDLSIRATNSHGVLSNTVKRLTVIVKAPIYKTKLAVLLYGVLAIIAVFWLIHLRTRNLSRVNKEYREKERIAKKIEQQKEELTLKNKNITDSINYARRIQLAMMPSVRIFKSLFPDSFILHMPKDIVSGDFYWVNRVQNKVFFSAVDCTGHGVPGAFMSIIGVELFRRITEIEKINRPADVLNSLSKNFERVFGDVDEMKLRDGMDLAFCSLNEEQTVLEYAGAFNPLYIVRDSSIIEIKGDRHSVGVYEEDDEVRSFNNHSIPVYDGDIVYIFTDGYLDQFGGPEGKKYKYRRFRHLLLALHQLSMEKQEEFLRQSILEWKGNQDQVDDILVMGLRIHQKKTK